MINTIRRSKTTGGASMISAALGVAALLLLDPLAAAVEPQVAASPDLRGSGDTTGVGLVEVYNVP